ncbi:MAG: ArsR/SmtB family transcription factor, partial [Pseudonocardiaceae bacterium]
MASVTADAVPDPALADEHSPDRPVPGPAATRPRTTLAAAGELLRALSEPVRIAIVLQLRDSERCVHELVDALGV